MVPGLRRPEAASGRPFAGGDRSRSWPSPRRILLASVPLRMVASFGADKRAGIGRTLQRISAMRKRAGIGHTLQRISAMRWCARWWQGGESVVVMGPEAWGRARVADDGDECTRRVVEDTQEQGDRRREVRVHQCAGAAIEDNGGGGESDGIGGGD
ncbi:unnamed protein product [Closterium sp. NIES-65]|nr:unnamed protein product [Closterium sp. NIES-65]